MIVTTKQKLKILPVVDEKVTKKSPEVNYTSNPCKSCGDKKKYFFQQPDLGSGRSAGASLRAGA